MIAAIFSEFGGYIVAGLAVLAGAFGLYVKGRSDGKTAVEPQLREAEKAAENAAQSLNAIKGAQDAQNDNRNLPADARRERLRDEWSR